MEKKSKTGQEKILKVIELPNGIVAYVSRNILQIKSQSGEVSREFKQRNIFIKVHDNNIIMESERSVKKDKKIIGSLAAHIRNMLNGVQQKHTYVLKICSGHFPMNVSVSNNKLLVKNFLGEKVPRTLSLKPGADIKIEGDLIYVTSTNKETAGQVSADIEQLTRRPGYDTRVFQDGVYLINKDGKELK